MSDTVLVSRRVALPTGLGAAAVHVEDGRIVRITSPDDAGPRATDLGDLVIAPGFVDSHVHVNEPGRTSWEGFATATRAAAAGGTTTIVDMPLNSIPPTTTVAGLAVKREAALGGIAVDVAFWGGVVPGNRDELAPLAEAGVVGFKAFLADSGVPEFPPVGADDLAPALETLAVLGLPLIAHAELAGPMADAQARFQAAPTRQRRSYASYLASRPPSAEAEAVELLASLAERAGAHAHVVHLSAAPALAPLRAARARGVRLSAETCPHYLALAAEDVPDGATEFKCAPPIRDARNREALWAALRDGSVGMVVSDHSPCTPELKRRDEGDFGSAWGGIASVELRFAATWTAARERGVQLGEVLRWLSAAPAALAGVGRKGRISVGADADLVVLDPDTAWTVDPDQLHQRHPVTPYAGRSLHGVVRSTLVRGQIVYADGQVVQDARGRLLERDP